MPTTPVPQDFDVEYMSDEERRELVRAIAAEVVVKNRTLLDRLAR